MKISVIMVTLNAAAVIDDALQSVQAQRHRPLELIIVDGLSTDTTLDIVARHPGLQPLVIRGPDNGIYDAMNKGIAAASGDALFFLNADDRLAQPDALGQLADSLQRSGADLAFGDILVSGGAADVFRSHRHVSRRTLGHESLSHQAVLARRSAFNSLGGFDTRYSVCADLDWFMRCHQAGLRSAHVPRLICRCLAGGHSERHYGVQLDEVQHILRMYRRLPERLVQRVAAAVRRRLRRAFEPGA